MAQAREASHDALVERGILPFLWEALADPGSAALGRRPSPAPSRIPQLGYGRPGFSSPDGGPAAGPRPSFTSPDFEGPEHSRSDRSLFVLLLLKTRAPPIRTPLRCPHAPCTRAPRP